MTDATGATGATAEQLSNARALVIKQWSGILSPLWLKDRVDAVDRVAADLVPDGYVIVPRDRALDDEDQAAVTRLIPIMETLAEKLEGMSDRSLEDAQLTEFRSDLARFKRLSGQP